MSTEPLVPFKGLASFHDSPADVAFFFGRDREREVIEANLMASRLTIVYGVFLLWCMNQRDVVDWLMSRTLRD